jgi:hypothetical protein
MSFCNVTQCFLDKKFFDAKFSHVRNQISKVPSKLTKKGGMMMMMICIAMWRYKNQLTNSMKKSCL